MPDVRIQVINEVTPQDNFGTCNTPGIGTNATDQQILDQFEALKSAGLGWMRTDFLWSTIEPTTKGTFNWTRPDRLVSLANQAGIKILPILCYSVGWANGGQATNVPPTNVQDYADFAAAVVNRYVPQGIMHYEIWNEANQTGFWNVPSGADYAKLLKAAYISIKAAQPQAKVLFTGQAPNTSGTAGNNMTFLQDVYTAIGNGYFDILCHHPYEWFRKSGNIGWAEGIINNLRDIMVANGDANKKMWFTEIGRPTGGNGNFSTELEQAEMLQASIREMRRRPYIEKMFFYCFNDFAAPSDTADREQHFGIRRNDLTWKPAYQAVRRAILYG